LRGLLARVNRSAAFITTEMDNGNDHQKADRTGHCVLELSGEKIFGTLTQPFEKRW